MRACEKCGSEQDTEELNIPVHNENPKIVLCLNCRIMIFDQNILQDSSPMLCITKEVPLTFTEEDWAWITVQSEGNIARFFRMVVLQSKRYCRK